jgi:hypothetical protein
MGAIVQVEAAKDDPCKAMPYLVTDTGAYHPAPETMGDSAFAGPTCTPAGANAWRLESRPHDGDPWLGYAERRDGVLLVLSNSDDWTHPNFQAIAATLGHLDDEHLGALI